jgi:hypothetical protein
MTFWTNIVSIFWVQATPNNQHEVGSKQLRSIFNLTSVDFHRTTRRCTLKDGILHSHGRWNINSKNLRYLLRKHTFHSSLFNFSCLKYFGMFYCIYFKMVQFLLASGFWIDVDMMVLRYRKYWETFY